MNEGTGSESREEHSDARRNLAEWVGVFAGPIAWAIHQQLSYSLVPWVCHTGHRFVLYLTNVFFFLMAIAGGVLSWTIYEKLKREAAATPSLDIARQRFLVTLGMMTSALFASIIVAQALANFFINPCQE